MRRRIAMPAIAAMAMLMLVACSDDSGQEVIDRERLADLDAALWERTEELTVECMRDSGFEYVPRPYSGRDSLRFAGSPFELTLDEAQERGFGFTDSVVSGAGEMIPDDEDRDANERLQESLPESQQGPWALALEGSPDSSTPGCRTRAQAQADADHADDIAELVTRRANAGRQLEADPRFAEMWEQWSDCMSDRGIAARDLDDLQMSLIDEAHALVALPVPDDPSDLDDGTFDDTVELDLDAVSDVREREIAAAAASVTCLEPLEDTYLSMLEEAMRSHD